ncbi:MAG TPA: hypothetical protein VGK59_11125 [Ohtaekwangia sp.]
MKTLFTIAFALITAITFAQGSWTSVNIIGSTRYDDIHFTDSLYGWTAGGWSMKVHKSINGGNSWNALATFDKYLRCVKFMDRNIGLVGSLDSSLYRTTDGGKTWEDVAPNITPQPAGVCGLAKADENTIYGVGIWSEPAFVIKSTDKGLNWRYIDMSAYANTLIDVFFFDADHGFVTGSVSEEEGGIVLYTDNGGATWEEKFRTNHTGDRIWKIQTPDNKHFYGSVESWADETRMIRSADRGQTWEMITVDPEYYYIQTVGFLDSLRGWTGGNSTLFETSDGGNHWKKISVGSTYNRFVKVTDKTAFLTGAKVYKYTYKDPPPVVEPPPITGIPDKDPYDPIHQLSVSPNPASENATVNVTFGKRTMTHIYVYNPTGKKVKKIFDGMVEAGNRSFPLNTADLPDQLFLVIFKTNEGMESIKVIKHSGSH